MAGAIDMYALQLGPERPRYLLRPLHYSIGSAMTAPRYTRAHLQTFLTVSSKSSRFSSRLTTRIRSLS
jgi:hypothetical protein